MVVEVVPVVEVVDDVEVVPVVDDEVVGEPFETEEVEVVVR